jgi:hypothetical protein
MNFDLLKGWMNESYGFLNSNVRETAIAMLKIQLLAIVPVLITLIMAGVLVFMAPAGLTVFAIILGAIFVIVGVLVSGAISSAGYNAVDSIAKRKKTDIIATAEENLIPYVKYALIMLGILMVPILPLIILLIAAYMTMPLVGSLMEILVRILISIISAIVYLFAQFAILETVLSKSGAIDSYRKSYRMARKNLLETIAMSFLLWVVESAINLAFILAIVMVVLVGVIIGIGGLSLGLESPEAAIASLALPAILIIIVVFAMLMLVVDAAVRTILLPAQYFFWKKIKY